MPIQKPHTALPLEWLFVRLQAAGFAMDTRRKLRLLQLLEEKSADYLGSWQELKYLLAPFIAQTPEEQRLFYEIFDQFRNECQAEAEKLFTEKSEAEKAAEPAPWWRRHSWLWPLALLILAAPWIFRAVQPDRMFPVEIDQATTMGRSPWHTGDTVRIFNLTAAPDTTGFTWEVRDAATGALDHSDSTGFTELQWVLPDYGRAKNVILKAPPNQKVYQPAADTLLLPATLLLCADTPRVDPASLRVPAMPLLTGVLYDFSLEVQYGERVEWLFSTGDTLRGPAVSKQFDTENNVQLRIRVHPSEDRTDCYIQYNRSLTIASDKPTLQTAVLRPDHARLQLSLHPLYWTLVLSTLLGSLLIIALWANRQRKKPAIRSEAELEREYPVHDAAPYFIPYRSQEKKISVPPEFFRMAEVLRRREAGLRKVFDAAHTVQATVESGGYPNWRDRPLSRPAEYLMLVRRRDQRHQQDQLFYRLVQFLRRQDIPAAVFFHDGRFHRFSNEQYPEGFSLEQLHRRYPDHRLVILGDGHGLVNPYATVKPALLEAPLQVLQRWPRRLLLTTEPVADWSFQEGLLQEVFRLHPADTEGILVGLEALDRDEDYIPGSFNRRQADLLSKHVEPGARYRTWDRMEDIQSYLEDDPDLFRWFCGLAVVAQPDWALTIAIGRAMGIEVIHNRLLRLSRIPWLAENAPPGHLRLAFLKLLSPEDEKIARRAVTEELDAVKDQVSGSLAASEWVGQLAVQHFALAPKASGNKQTILDLQQIGLLSQSQLEELDLIVQERTDKKGVPQRATKNLTAWLESPTSKFRYTPDFILANLLFYLSLFGLIWGWNYNRQDREIPSGQTTNIFQSTTSLDDEALQWHNLAVSKDQALDTLQQEDWNSLVNDTLGSERFAVTAANIDQLFNAAIEARRPEPYALADSNYWQFKYNAAARFFNFFLEDTSLTISEANFDQLWSPPWVMPEEKEDSIALGLNQTPSNTGRRWIVDYFYPQLGFGLEKSRAFQFALLYHAFRQAIPPGNAGDPRRLAALHGQGLSAFYLAMALDRDSSWLDSAQQARQKLLTSSNGRFFDSIRVEIPINLQTLLEGLETSPSLVENPNEIDQPQSEIPQQRPATITAFGIVLDFSGRAVAGADILARPADGIQQRRLDAGRAPQVWTSKSDRNGDFILENIPEDIGFLQINVEAEGYPPLSTTGNPNEPLTLVLDTDTRLQATNTLLQVHRAAGYQVGLVNPGNKMLAPTLITAFQELGYEHPVFSFSDIFKDYISPNYPNLLIDDKRAKGNFLFFGSPASVDDGLEMEIATLKSKSHALLVGVSDYQASYLSDLRSTADNINRLSNALQQQGFTVEVLSNPIRAELDRKINDIVDRYQKGAFADDGQFLLYLAGYSNIEEKLFLTSDSQPDQSQTMADLDAYGEIFAQGFDYRNVLFIYDLIPLPESPEQKTTLSYRLLKDNFVQDTRINSQPYYDSLSIHGEPYRLLLDGFERTAKTPARARFILNLDRDPYNQKTDIGWLREGEEKEFQAFDGRRYKLIFTRSDRIREGLLMRDVAYYQLFILE